MSIKRTIITAMVALTLVAVVVPAVASAATVQDLMNEIAALQAQLNGLTGSTTTASGTGACAGVTFTRNLTVGSTGTDVKCLQQILSVTPMSGYFGPITLAAVKEYQETKGFVPANQVGPMTRAALNSSLGSTTTTTTTTTGLPAGCASSSQLYNSITGLQNCGSTTTTTTTQTGINTPGSTGYLTTPNLSASPASNSNVTATKNVPVLGVDVRATGSDMIINSAEVGLTVIKNATSEEFPSITVQNLYVYDGSTLLGTYPVNSSTVLTGSSSTTYYMILSGFKFVAPMNTTKSLTITADFTPGLESNRQVTVNLYDQGLRGYDGTGAYSSASSLVTTVTVSGATLTFSGSSTNYRQDTVTYTSVGSSTLTSSIDPSTPVSSDVAVSDVNGTTDVPVSVLDFKSTTGSSKITSITLTATGNTGNAASAIGHINALKLYDGSTLIGSQTLSAVSTSRTATFSNLSIQVEQDTTKALTVKADMAAGSNLTNGTYFKVSIASASDVSYQTPALSSTTATGTATGNNMYFYDGGATAIGFVSGVATFTPNAIASTNDLATGILTFNFQANGGTTTEPAVGDFTVVACATSDATCASPVTVSKAIQVTPSSTSGIANGGTAQVAVSASFTKAANTTGYYFFKVTAINWAMTGVTGTMSASPSGTDNDSSAITNWKTGPVYVY